MTELSKYLSMLQNLISETIGKQVASITEATTLADLGLDSLDTFQVVLLVESRYGVILPLDGSEEMSTLGDVARLMMGSSGTAYGTDTKSRDCIGRCS